MRQGDTFLGKRPKMNALGGITKEGWRALATLMSRRLPPHRRGIIHTTVTAIECPMVSPLERTATFTVPIRGDL